MRRFFHPESVAVVGASGNPKKGGHVIIENLKKGYEGPIYPVNLTRREILGLKCYPSILDIPGPVDLAIIIIPAKGVPKVIEDCARKGVHRVLVESGGFAETGRRDLQDEISRIARESGMRLWGPNCMGIVSHDITTIFLPPPEVTWGNTGIIAQSGMLTAGLLYDAIEGGWRGISCVCSMGNKADVNECDVLEYLVGDPETDLVLLYMEGSLDGRRFMRIARSTDKPIIVLAGGESVEGQRAATSHTASITSDHRILKAALRQAGCVLVDDFNELLDVAKPFSMYVSQEKPRGNRIAVVTITGGGGVIASDIATRNGLQMAELAEETLEKLDRLFPTWMPPRNPIDYWPTMEIHGMNETVEGCLGAALADPGVDCAVFTVGPFWRAAEMDPLIIPRLVQTYGKPVTVWLSGDRDHKQQWGDTMESNGVPVYYSLERAVSALAKYVLHYQGEKHRDHEK